MFAEISPFPRKRFDERVGGVFVSVVVARSGVAGRAGAGRSGMKVLTDSESSILPVTPRLLDVQSEERRQQEMSVVTW